MKALLRNTCITFLVVLCTCFSSIIHSQTVNLVKNPYADVNWSTYNQYKSNHHTHTTNSDGSQSPSTVINEYGSAGYSILAISDHNYITWPWPHNDYGMLAIKGDEYSTSHHMNAFLDFTISSSNLENGIPHVETTTEGKSQINHPGRYNSPSNWSWYIPWFRDYSSCIVLEVFNQGDRYSSDRQLWDNINENLFPQSGKFAWGSSNDDKHTTSHLYGNFNFMLMPDLTETAWKECMENGAFYFCYEPGRSGNGDVPRINNIVVDTIAKTITITGTGYNSIEWMGPGTTVVATGNVFDYSSYTDEPFIRAVLDGSNGDSYTQPFGFETSGSTGSTGTVDVGISANNDDAEQKLSDGTMDLGSSDIELGDDPGYNEDQLVGLLFRNIDIPQGATITSAYLTFETDEVDTDPTSVDIRAHDVDNASDITSSVNNLSDRTLTTASVNWNIPEWNTVSEKHQSPDISSVIQEIVDRGGWAPNNKIAIVIGGSGSRTAESYDGESANAAQLHIEYDTIAIDPCDPIASGNLDTDDDGVSDICDLDDDNDGILDTDEGDETLCNNNSLPDMVTLLANGVTTLPDGITTVTTTVSGVGTSTPAAPTSHSGPPSTIRVEDQNNEFYSGNNTWTDYALVRMEFSAPIEISGGFNLYDIDWNQRGSVFGSLNGDLVPVILTAVNNTTLTTGTFANYPPGVTSAGSFDILVATPNGTNITLDGTATMNALLVDNLYFIWNTGDNNSSTSSVYIGLGGNVIICNTQLSDSDNDGISNSLDLDSDNDGCPDAIEGGGTYDYDDIDGNYRLTVAVDGDGIPGGNSQTIGTSQDSTQQSDVCNPCHEDNPGFTDNDLDGVGDYCDLDDDNDGILDEEEVSCISPDFASIATTGDATAIINSTPTLFGLSDLTISHTVLGTATFDNGDNDVSNGHTGGGAYGPNFGVLNSAGLSNSLETTYDFSIPLLKPTIQIWDIDETDAAQIKGYNNGTEVAYTRDFIGSSLEETPLFSFTTTAGNTGNVSGNVNNSVEVTFEDFIDEIIITWYDRGPNTGGSYTIIFPEACSEIDSDGDGDPDHLDLDSDDDGCVDAIEAAGSFTINDIVNDTLTGGVDSDGIPIVVSPTGQATTPAVTDDNLNNGCNPPVAVDDNYSVAEDASVVLTPLTDDTDADGDQLTITSINGTTLTPGTAQSISVPNGTVDVAIDGTITFTPDENYNGQVSFPYEISDGNGGTDSANEIIDITPVNDPPEAVVDNYNTDEDTPIILTPLTGDSDVDGDQLTIISINGTSLTPGTAQSISVPNGTVDVAVDGTITFIPDQHYYGQVTFPYEISDGNGGTDTANEVIDIASVIDYPIATNNHSLSNTAGPITQQVVTEDDGNGMDNDPDGSLDFSSIDLDPSTAGQQVSLPVSGEGTWSVDGSGNVTFTPETGFTNDPTPILYTIDDTEGNTSNQATITLDYVSVAVNDTSDDNPSTTAVTVDVTTNDTDGDIVDPATVDLDASSIPGSSCTDTDASGDCIEVTVPGEGIWTVDESTGEVTFTPESGFLDDPQIIDYSVEDDEGNASSASIEIIYLCSTVQLKALLEGPWITAKTMSTVLNDNHLLPGQDKDLSPNFSVQVKATHTPFGQPYSIAPWSYSGNSGMKFGDASSPSAPGNVVPYDGDVVDWILVTVREDGILPANNVWQCSGWLKSNGDITFPEECACLRIAPTVDYHIMIEQRNHLGILSPTPVNKLSGTAILEWDFTSQDSYRPFVFRVGQKEISTGIWAMYAGNGNQDPGVEAINSSDQTVWKNDQNEINYLFGDLNLNVIANSADETIWKNNQNLTSGVTFY